MQTIKCLIVDDEPLSAELIQGHIAQFPKLEVVATCWNAVEALEILKNQAIDLIFLDIQMPMLNGIEFVRSLKTPPSIIFITAYRDYAVESYELDVEDYLLKPITFNRFFKSINKFLSRYHTVDSNPIYAGQPATDEEAAIYVNANRKYIKVPFKEVQFIESLKDYVKITLHDKQVVTKDKISAFELKLPDYFLRIHRSFIVNTKKVTAFTIHDVEILDREIPIGISYRKEVLAYLKKG